MSGATPVDLMVGTYTNPLPHVDGRAEGVLAVAVAADTGSLGPARTLAHLTNPSWLVINSSGDRLYAASETLVYNGTAGGSISVFGREGSQWTRLDEQPSGGLQPCHAALDHAEERLLVANYGSGSIVAFDLRADGTLGTASVIGHHVGAGPDTERQSCAHPHQICIDPRTHDIVVPDLGLDRVVFYSHEPDGNVHERVSARLTCPPGSGPRHVAFHPDLVHLLVLTELSNTVMCFRRNGAGGFDERWTTSTLPTGFDGFSHAAALKVTPDGTKVFITNRGHDSVCTLALDAEQCTVRSARWVASGGHEPRDLTLLDGGRFLYVANQNSDNVVQLELLAEGDLVFRGERRVSTPVCLVFS